MRKLKLPLPIIAFFFLIVTGCKKEIKSDKTTPDKLQTESINKKNPTLSSAELQARFEKLRASLPPGYGQRLIENTALQLKQHPQYRDLVRRVLAVTPTPCDANTLINQWLNQELADWDNNITFLAIITGMLDFPTYDALLFENSSANQYFGVNGEYTQVVTKTFKDLQRFWNIQSEDIVLVAMHGSMLRDRDRLIRIDMILFGDPLPVAEFWADLILELLAIVPQYRNGDHPIFTFNAFAQPSFNFPPYGIIPDKIVLGDGVLDGYVGIGYGDVAPQAIVAHEFGHHIQFQLDLFSNVNSPEETRRTELMADAYAAYYLSHSRGASMQWKRVQQFLQVFFTVGDCAFTSDGHHGTPTQRMAAAAWGYSIANEAQKQGHILTAEQFTALFEAKLPELVLQ